MRFYYGAARVLFDTQDDVSYFRLFALIFVYFRFFINEQA